MATRNSNPRTTREEQARNRALHVLARMRRTGQTLTAAAREEHIDPRTVRKHIGIELKRFAKEGTIYPSKSDQRARQMLIPTSQGTTPATIRGSAQASVLGRYMAAVGKFLRTGDTDALDEFEGRSIAGHRLITDPEELSLLAEAGSLQIDSIYAMESSQ
jgi:hypothetical protein